jgi:hypothetical protein
MARSHNVEDMSTVAEIVAAVEKLPEPEKTQLMERLRNLESASMKKKERPFVVKTWPLGIRSDKLPSHLLEELEEEEYLHKLREGR